MKKILILLALAFTTSIAQAWHNNCHEGIVILAVEHLDSKAKSAVENYLGDSYIIAFSHSRFPYTSLFSIILEAPNVTAIVPLASSLNDTIVPSSPKPAP